MKFFFKQILKVSAFYLEKQKSFIHKKKISRGQHQNKKAFFTNPFFIFLHFCNCHFYLLENIYLIFSKKKIFNIPFKAQNRFSVDIERVIIYSMTKKVVAMISFKKRNLK